MTIKEAILQSLEDLRKPSNHKDIYKNILSKKYYDFKTAKTPEATISALLGDFIRKDDSRVRRIKSNNGTYFYYLSKHEQNLIDIPVDDTLKKELKVKKTYHERDLHKLLSSYLKSKNIYSKTILHEESKNSKDNNQKWIHPDMIGIEFLNLKNKVSKAFMKQVNPADTFKITSYEIKREINTDYELKKCYFQAVSNSSWANYGYLVAFEISDNLKDEMERLNQSFGIGIIELKANPYESKILFQSKFRELDFKTIDKLCGINQKYKEFIKLTKNILEKEEEFYYLLEKELNNFCDDYFQNDTDIELYCKKMNIPIEETDNKIE